MFGLNASYSITGLEFEALVDEKALIFVDFWAPWCQPCLEFGKVYEEIADLNRDISFIKINVEEEQVLAESFHIRSIPHVMVLKLGIVIYSESGFITRNTLLELVKQARDADVRELKEQIDRL